MARKSSRTTEQREKAQNQNMDTANRAVLDKAVGDILKRYGDGSIMRLGEAQGMVTEVIPTGSLSLDIALGVGGIPRGRVIEIYGPQSSGKTTLCQHIADQMADFEKFDTLRSFTFFADFSDVEIWEVVRFSQWSRVSPGTVIITDGIAGDCFYFLAEGELKVLKNGLILDLLTSGECFGEMAVIGKTLSRRGADIIALTDAQLVKVMGSALQDSSESCRMHFYQSFLAVLSTRLTSANVRLVSF